MRLNRVIMSFILFLVMLISQACTSNAASSQTHNSVNLPVANVTPTSKESKTSDKKLMDATIDRVVDGDTMKILINKKKETVRLLLVDTPETVKPNTPVQPFGKEASNFAKKALSGKNVKIEIDVSERDKYGRLLVYLYVDGKMFNETLLEKGLARVAYVYPPNVKYIDQFREIQKKVQKQGIGIWSVENYAQQDGFHVEVFKSQDNKSNKTNTVQVKMFNSCKEAKEAGKTPLRKGEAGYNPNLDGDKDGIACER